MSNSPLSLFYPFDDRLRELNTHVNVFCSCVRQKYACPATMVIFPGRTQKGDQRVSAGQARAQQSRSNCGAAIATRGREGKSEPQGRLRSGPFSNNVLFTHITHELNRPNANSYARYVCRCVLLVNYVTLSFYSESPLTPTAVFCVYYEFQTAV